MATLATVALSCAKHLGRANAAGTAIADLDTEIKEEIAEAIRFYNRTPWALTEFRGLQITTVSGTTWYSAFDMTSGDGDQSATGRTAVDINDCLSIKYMRGPTSTLDYRMRQISYDEFEELLEGVTPQGPSTVFALYAGQIGFWPIPDDAYTIYFSGHVKPVVPSGNSDTSVWFDQAQEMVAAGACARVCLKYLRDAERAREFAVIEKAAMDAFHAEYVRKTSTRKLRPHD